MYGFTIVVVIVCCLIHVVFGGYPISEPFTLNKDNGGKTVAYNMIDTNPSCYQRGLCPMFKPGGKLSAFPNSEEKVQHTFHNLFRMFANWTLELKYGKWRFGANKNGGRTYWCPGCKYCGDGTPGKAPLYWYADANQAARFKQYDENSCDQDWYKQNGVTAHHTCNWVLDEFGGGSHCDLFGGCEFSSRASAFCEEDRCWFETEGICAANTCYVDPHCEPIFASGYDYQGTGFVEGMNGASAVYSRFTKEIFYVLPSGAHFDERLKLVEEDYDKNGQYFTLMLEYYDHNQTQKPDTCWSIYNGTAHEMKVIVSNNGDLNNGFSKNSYSVMFATNHNPPHECEPYAFMCKTTLNNFFRLPEQDSYYFGTEWIDWKWSNYSSYGKGYTCKENHYYFDETEQLWIANGGPTLKRKDIWYYRDTHNYGSCIGCSKIAKLQCYELCILSDFTDCDGCDDIIGQIEPPILTFDDNTPNIGGIIVGVLIALVACIFLTAHLYCVYKTAKPVCPLVGIKRSAMNDNNVSTCARDDGETKTKKVVIKKEKEGNSSTVAAMVASMNNNNNKDTNEKKCSNASVKKIMKKENTNDETKNEVIGQLLCNECQQSKAIHEGKIDESDGFWYCKQCWKQFSN